MRGHGGCKYDATDQLTNMLCQATDPESTPSAWTNEVRCCFDAAGNRTNATATNSSAAVYQPSHPNQDTNFAGTSPC